MKSTILNIVLLSIIVLFTFEKSFSCSMYKVTVNGKTMVGNNEDSWRLTSQIWFEKGTKDNYGVAYVGYSDKQHSDGAMNEVGLIWDAFSMYHKPDLKIDKSKQECSWNDIKIIMQQCETVDEVYHYLSSYNFTFLNGSPLSYGGMLLFVDKSGKYLTIEADTMILGNKDKFVLANFSVSETKDLSTVKIKRYRKGIEFLKNKIDTSLAFCSALSDTMSVCRPKAGDGTLYTTIYDLNNGIIHLYFFHDFKNLVTFNLKEELKKENHVLDIPSLFSSNDEYISFSNYKTPQNNKIFFWLLVSIGVLFLFSSSYFFVSFFRRKKLGANSKFSFDFIKLLPFSICLILSYYIYVLMKNQAIFYFPTPYKDYEFSILNIAAYIPFLLLLLIFPLVRINFKIFRQNHWGLISKWLLTVNNFGYIILLCLFTYWELFNIFS